MLKRTTGFIFLSILFISFNHVSLAQNDEAIWFQGQVKLINGETYPLSIRFVSERTGGLLQVMTKGESMTLSPKKVSSFEFFDTLSFKSRQFISVSINSPNQKFEKQSFLEVLYDGVSLSLLKVGELNGVINTQSLYIYDKSERAVYHFAMSRWAKSEKTPFINPNVKMLYDLIKDHKNELKDYSNQNGLNLKYTDQIIQFLSYYDNLTASTSQKVY